MITQHPCHRAKSLDVLAKVGAIVQLIVRRNDGGAKPRHAAALQGEGQSGQVSQSIREPFLITPDVNGHSSYTKSEALLVESVQQTIKLGF